MLSFSARTKETTTFTVLALVVKDLLKEHGFLLSDEICCMKDYQHDVILTLKLMTCTRNLILVWFPIISDT